WELVGWGGYEDADNFLGERISRRKTALFLIAKTAILLLITPTFAQHTLAAKFDTTKTQTLKGTVTQVDWSNPYVHIMMKVPGSPRPVLWAVELDSALMLKKNGWTSQVLPLGETITVQGSPARNGSNQISGNTITNGAGKKLFSGANGTIPARKVASGPTPRWPNNQPRLGPPPGETGYWGNPSRTSLLQDGAK